MTKAELVSVVATKADMTKIGAERALNALLEAAYEALVKQEKVILTGFATFTVEDRKARKGRNPRTGKEINIPATKGVKFRVGKELKEAFK